MDNSTNCIKKNQQIFFYAWLDNKGELDHQQGYKNKKPLAYARNNADWMCISSHTCAWYLDNGIRKCGKTKENIHTVYYCYLDLDCNDLLLSSDVIKQRCNAYDLPYPTYIINTSPNHYHLLWKLKKPIINRNPKILEYWSAVEKLLFECFKDLGADQSCLDPNRYLRNPFNADQVNTKYPDKPRITIEETAETVMLSDLYDVLINHFYTPPDRKPSKVKQPYEVSKRKLFQFFRKNREYQGTYKDISELLQIPERTLYQICKWFEESGILQRIKTRIGNTWNTIYRFLKVDTADISNSYNTNKKNKSFLIETFKKISITAAEYGIPRGCRNDGYFVLSLYLKNYEKWKPDRIFKFFSPGARLSDFKESELWKIINSAFKPDYDKYPGLQCEKFIKLCGAVNGN